MTLFPRIMALLRENGLDDVLVGGGGIIPREDISALQDIGVRGIFGPGTLLDEIVQFIKVEVARSKVVGDDVR